MATRLTLTEEAKEWLKAQGGKAYIEIKMVGVG